MDENTIIKDKEVKETGVSDLLIEERRKKFFYYLKNSQLWVFIAVILLIILGVYIRYLPMTDHGDHPGLWDITKNSWTLGPDLDPWLFLRTAKTIIETGNMPDIDMMRNVPLGFDSRVESLLLPYLIVWTYKLLNFIGVSSNVEFAGALFPVIAFGLTIISFFLFVREIFVEADKKSVLKANLIAIISTLFMITIPVFLSRTVAGIPEKESIAFFFMFLSFYFFLKAWKSKNYFFASIFGILSGVSTALMGLVWGGVLYAFIPISLASLIAFVLNKFKNKEALVFGFWVIFSFWIMIVFSHKYTLAGLATSTSSGLMAMVLFIFLVDLVLSKTKLKIFREQKIPGHLISLIISIILIFLLVLVFLGPEFLIAKFEAIHHTIFTPVMGRWNITVAENRQPYFTEWSSSFGPFIKNIPLFFWMFFIGSVLLFRKMTKHLKDKDSWTLTGLFVLFFFGIVFSRYSGNSILNGENFISKLFYYFSVILLVVFVIYYYIQYHKKEDAGFEQIRFEYILLFAVYFLTLFTARGAVRLIMVLGPIAPIFVAFLIIETIDLFRNMKNETWKIVLLVFILLILAASIFSFWSFYQSVKNESYAFIPSPYNHQWQKAMEWVRNETPQNAVFAHWWDYGYWLQSIGERATVVDGGNAIVYWNYLMGRLVLTGDNQSNALEFLYSHNATHLLIDSTDIGKYTAFSSIGSNKDYDRYSWIGEFLLDESQTQEMKNETIYIYTGSLALDEDLVIKEEGKDVLLPRQKAGVGAIVLPTINGDEGGFKQPYVIVVYQGKQHKINLRYLHINGKFFDFKEGVESCAFVFPRIEQQGQGVRQNPVGAALFISPRLFRGMLSQIYILDDPLKKFPNFKLAHDEPSLFIQSLKDQGMALPDFVYFNGIHGPIKIWEIKYTGKEKIREDYLDKDYTKYLDWQL